MQWKAPDQNIQFLTGGGEMGELIRKKNWSLTSLGSPGNWPQSLRTALSILINSKFAMFLWWGPELICFYNDAYRPSLGQDGKHPSILGQGAEEAWPEIWTIIKPLIEQVLSGGEATWMEDQLIPIYRNGKIEDVYWTFSYSPVNDESGTPAGVFVTCSETTEKVRNLQRLQSSQDELRFAIDAAELGTYDYNPLTNRFSANHRLKEWFGLPAATEMELSKAINAIAEKDQQRVIEAIQRSLDPSSGGRFEIEYTIIHPVTGKSIIVEAKGKAWYGEDKKAYRLNGTLREVTERTRAENEMQKLIGIIEASNEFISLAGVDAVIQYAGPAALKMLGWDDYKGKTIFDCIYPEDLPFAEKVLPELFAKGSFSHEIRFVNARTGFPFWLQWNGVAIKDPLSGEIVGLATISPNITERKKSEEELSKTTKRLQLALEAGKLGSYELEIVSGDLRCSIQCKQNFGLDASSQLNYSGLLELIAPEDREAMQAAVQDSIHNTAVYDAEYRIYWPDGTLHWIHAAGIPVFSEEGIAIQMIGVTVDITEQKLFEQELGKQVNERTRELEQKNIDLEKMNRELQSFAYVSSHDLQEPLRKIQTFSDLILSKELTTLSDKGKHYFTRIQYSAKRMRTLIADLLAYSRTNTTDKGFEMTDLKEIVKGVEEELKEALQEKNGVIRYGELCAIPIIPFQFRQLFQNLFLNSLKFSSPGRPPVITVEARLERAGPSSDQRLIHKKLYCSIIVSDNGIGFAPQYKEKVFEVFQRLHPSDQYEGTGIGLAIVKKIVENHSGIITATGELDKGASFELYIPIKAG